MVCEPGFIKWRGGVLIWREQPITLVAPKPRGYSYLSFDDDVARSGGSTAPVSRGKARHRFPYGLLVVPGIQSAQVELLSFRPVLAPQQPRSAYRANPARPS